MLSKRRRTEYDTSIFYNRCIFKEDLNIHILSRINHPCINITNINDFNAFISHLNNLDCLYLDVIKKIKNYSFIIKFEYSKTYDILCEITLNNVLYYDEKIFENDINIMKEGKIPIFIKIKSCLNYDPCVIDVLNKPNTADIKKLFQLYEKFCVNEYNKFMKKLTTEIYDIKKKVVIHDVIKNIKYALTFNPDVRFLLCGDKNYVINEINKEYIKIINILLNPNKIIKEIFNTYDLIDINKSSIVIEYNEFMNLLKTTSTINEVYEEYEILHHNINIDLNNIIKHIDEYIEDVISVSNISLFEEYKKIKSSYKDKHDFELNEKIKLLNDMKL